MTDDVPSSLLMPAERAGLLTFPITDDELIRHCTFFGFTEKTLTRATMSVAGVTTKAFIASRIRLEAKRLLIHTSLPVASIGTASASTTPATS